MKKKRENMVSNKSEQTLRDFFRGAKIKKSTKKPLSDYEVFFIPMRRKSDALKGASNTSRNKKDAIRERGQKKNEKHYRRKEDVLKLQKLSDEELILVVKKENKEMYRQLFQRYQSKLFSYILHLIGNKEEAQDVLQNVFVKTYNNLNHFDDDRKFSSWIYRIAHNEAVNYIKKRHQRYVLSLDDVMASKDKLEMSENDELIEEQWERMEISNEIDEALKKIPPKYYEVLRMRYFENYSYEKIGTIINKPINTVGTLISRAKKKLLEEVKKIKA